VTEAFSLSVSRFKGMLMSIDGRKCASVYRVKGLLVSIDLRVLLFTVLSVLSVIFYRFKGVLQSWI